ncbi:MAG: hypothetical protein KF847_12550 [Pirellulales bacterium]|nr:hypothetical protein [Pirellulales bacterium]
MFAIVLVGLGAWAATGRSAVIIGDFEGPTFPAAWGNWSTGPGNLGDFPKYSLSTDGATSGSQSLLLANAGYQQNLAFWAGVAGEPGSIADFQANDTILVDVTFPASAASGWAQIYEIAFNSQYGGYEGRDYSGQGVGWGDGGGGAQTITLSYDYSNHKAAWGANTPGYIQIIFATNSDSVHGLFHFDNVRLINSIPEPISGGLAALALVGVGAARRRRG